MTGAPTGAGGRAGGGRRLVWLLPLIGLPALGLVAALAVSAPTTRGTVPTGLLVGAALLGFPAALTAVTLVLCWRVSGTLNLAAPALGAAAAVLATTLTNAAGWWFPAAALLAVLGAGTLSGLTELVLGKRLSRRDPLVFGVATVAVAQLLVLAAVVLPGAVATEADEVIDASGERIVSPAVLLPPDSGLPGTGLDVGGVVLPTDQVVGAVVALAALAAVWWVLGHTRVGLLLRTLASDQGRAQLLGIPVELLVTATWAVAGGLAAVAALAVTPVLGPRGVFTDLGSTGAAAAPSVLLPALAAASAGGLVRIPAVVGAALGLSLAGQGVLWATGRPDLQLAVLAATCLAAVPLVRAAPGRPEGQRAWFASGSRRPLPAAAAGLPELRRIARGAPVVATVIVGVALLGLTSAQAVTLSGLLALGFVALAVAVVSGWGGQPTVGQVGVALVGALVAVRVDLVLQGAAPEGVGAAAAVLAGVAVGAATGATVSALTLRLPGHGMLVASLALAVLAADVLLTDRARQALVPSGITRPVFGGTGVQDERGWAALVLITFVLLTVLLVRLRGTRAVLALVAARDNPATSRAWGHRPGRLRVAAGGLAGAVAGLGGVVVAYTARDVASADFAAGLGVQVLLLAVVGGLGSILGVVAAVVLTATAQLFVPGLAAQLLVSGVTAVVVLMYAPGGLASVGLAARDVLARSLARRRGLVVPEIGAPDPADPLPLAAPGPGHDRPRREVGR